MGVGHINLQHVFFVEPGFVGMVFIVIAEGDQPGDLPFLHRSGDVVDGDPDIVGGVASAGDIVAGKDDQIRGFSVEHGFDEGNGSRINILVILGIGKLHDFKVSVLAEFEVDGRLALVGMGYGADAAKT
jgi:hypothetical protein